MKEFKAGDNILYQGKPATFVCKIEDKYVVSIGLRVYYDEDEFVGANDGPMVSVFADPMDCVSAKSDPFENYQEQKREILAKAEKEREEIIGNIAKLREQWLEQYGKLKKFPDLGHVCDFLEGEIKYAVKTDYGLRLIDFEKLLNEKNEITVHLIGLQAKKDSYYQKSFYTVAVKSNYGDYYPCELFKDRESAVKRISELVEKGLEKDPQHCCYEHIINECKLDSPRVREYKNLMAKRKEEKRSKRIEELKKELSSLEKV